MIDEMSLQLVRFDHIPGFWSGQLPISNRLTRFPACFVAISTNLKIWSARKILPVCGYF